MNIRMYNCYFGDCFKIANDSGNDLLVDMGIHRFCATKKCRENRFDEILSDLSDSTDFLLSHYHEDHYNGAVYISKNPHNFRFSDVYIPDIWNIKGSIEAISLHLLRIILDRSIIKYGTTLFSFLKAICKSKSKIHFVQRGVEIQNNYIALWPSEEYITNQAEQILANIQNGENNRDIELLKEYAKKLRKIVLRIPSNITIENGLIEQDYTALITQIDQLETEFHNTDWGFNRDNVSKSAIVDLRCFGNDISIVFQNKNNNNDKNILFTGDFGDKEKPWLWNNLEMNYDNNPDCKMHSDYHVIKVGHHGTRNYYHSFFNRINSKSFLLIPNGNKMNWKICSDYSSDVVNINANVVCSKDNACEAKNCNNNHCICTKRTIIDLKPNFFVDIK